MSQTKVVVGDPSIFLEEMSEKGQRISEDIRDLYRQMLVKLEEYNSCGKVVLFHRDSLLIKISPQEHIWNTKDFVINDLKITVSPSRNTDHLDEKTRLFYVLSIEFSIGFVEDGKPKTRDWKCRLDSFRMRVEEGGGGNYGVIYIHQEDEKHTREFDKFDVYDFSDFERLEGALYEGLKKLKIIFEKRK